MRLTYRDETGRALLTLYGKQMYCSTQATADCIARLEDSVAAYEDAKEQGRLVILPCKVGDALFVTDEGTILPAVRMVELVRWCNGKVLIRAVNSRTGIDYYCSAEDFGKTVFLTREEAKAKMGRGKDDG